MIIESKKSFLLIEEIGISIEIKYQDIDSITISSDDDANFPIEFNFYLTKPAKYYHSNNTLSSRFSTFLMNLFHKNSLNITINAKENKAQLILNEINKNLNQSIVINGLNNSRHWDETSVNLKIPGIKLIYSKNNQSLKHILMKKNKIKI